MNSVTVSLSAPVHIAGKHADKITFREPKVADLIAVENLGSSGQHALTVTMMAMLSGATEAEIRELSVKDYAACDRALRPFLLVDSQDGGS